MGAKAGSPRTLTPEGLEPPPRTLLDGVRLVRLPRPQFDVQRATERADRPRRARTGGLGLEAGRSLSRACGALLLYLNQRRCAARTTSSPFRPLDLSRRLIIDDVTERNLEIFVRLNGRRGTGTLRHVLDQTLTPMGGRLLRTCATSWRARPDPSDAPWTVVFFPRLRRPARGPARGSGPGLRSGTSFHTHQPKSGCAARLHCSAGESGRPAPVMALFFSAQSGRTGCRAPQGHRRNTPRLGQHDTARPPCRCPPAVITEGGCSKLVTRPP